MKAYKVVLCDHPTDRRYSRVEYGEFQVEYAKGLRSVPNTGKGPLAAFDSLDAAREFARDMRPITYNEIWECEVELHPGDYPYILGWEGSIACDAVTLTKRLA